jgi:hypothetical protein
VEFLPSNSLLALSGLDWTAPDFSTVSRWQKTLQVVIPYRGRTDALHLLVDSTGVKMLGEGSSIGDAPVLLPLLTEEQPPLFPLGKVPGYGKISTGRSCSQ